MSFLSKLRQQNLKDQGIKLCYLLEIDSNHHSIILNLVLMDIHQGKLSHVNASRTIKPYILKHQHLQSPPPFISNEDVPFLQSLINHNDAWSENSRGKLPDTNNSQGLHYILASQRCFITLNGSTRQLQAHDGQQISLYWYIAPSGDQYLRWQTPPFTQLFYLDRPYLFDIDNFTIAEGLCKIEAHALKAVIRQNKALPYHTVTHFLSEYQKQWQSWGLPLPKVTKSVTVEALLTPVIRLIGSKNGTEKHDTLHLEFRYYNDKYCGTIALAREQNEISYWDNDLIKCFQRQYDQEQHWVQQLKPFIGKFNQGIADLTWYSVDANQWKELLTQSRYSLLELGFSFVIEAGFRHHYLTPHHWQVDLKTVENENWQLAIEVQAENKTINLLELLQRLQSIKVSDDNNEYCLSMDDGRFLLLPKDNVSGLMEELGDLLGNNEGSYQLSHNQLNRLAPLRESLPKNTQWNGDIDLLERSINIHQQPEIQQNLIDSNFNNLNVQLRPYQRFGAFWLQHLKQHQINGLLADDMGLGKTLQTLAHLCLEQHLGQLKQPALIIVPTSLLHNWSSEIERFAPKLTFILLHGSQRHHYWEQLEQFDLIITSYSLIAKDLAMWKQQALSWIILDEAQMIKNRRTQIHEAIRQIDSHYRLCLSGTPVENHLGELWSIFDFLMPNCLGTYTQFNDYFRTPIEKDANSQRFEQLLQRIAPFMLRRTKEQVATDLPPKTEIYQNIIMNQDQHAFYDQLKSQTWSELESDSSKDTDENNHNSGQQHLQVLTALLKLRQACCDPLLLGKKDISSAKKAHCLEMIKELVQENRSIILFSQFTSMLDIIASELDQLDITYLMLTGASRNRQQLVQDFQDGKAPVFLISLKAGGVGLNLTRADTVIHYDPWWNSAAEQQASDRAHRIGQNNPVFVYKLIIENTIEEKIAQLQQRKAILSQNVGIQAQLNGEQFAYKLEDLLSLWNEKDKESSIESPTTQDSM